MERRGSRIARSLVAAAAAGWLVSSGPALANDDMWDTAANGVWETGTNWADNTAPGAFDTATFNLAVPFTVTFNGVPTPIRALTLTNAANVTFTSANSVDVRTLRVNSSLAGGLQDANILSGASLSLGTFVLGNSNSLHLTVGHELTVGSGSTLNARFGSDVVTSNLNINGASTANIIGEGSSLSSVNLSTATENKKSRRGGTPGGIPPRRLTR